LIFAVTDVHSAKQDEIEATPNVGLVFIDAKAKAYLSITARARVMRDTRRLRTFGERPTRCGGRADRPINVCLLRIEPLIAVVVVTGGHHIPAPDDFNRPCHWRPGGKRSAAFGPAELSGGIRVVPDRFSAMHQSDRGVTLSERILTRSYPAKATRS
jgi:hypothetical protein